MSHDEAFLSDIMANPDDNALRLIYADWLEEHGNPERAEFIRAQIELASPPGRGTRTRRRELERRVKALWNQHGAAWAARPGGGSEYLRYWERGFCAHLYAENVISLMEALPKRLREAPIQHARIGNMRRQELPQLSTWPLLAQLRSLSMFYNAFP